MGLRRPRWRILGKTLDCLVGESAGLVREAPCERQLMDCWSVFVMLRGGRFGNEMGEREAESQPYLSQ